MQGYSVDRRERNPGSDQDQGSRVAGNEIRHLLCRPGVIEQDETALPGQERAIALGQFPGTNRHVHRRRVQVGDKPLKDLRSGRLLAVVLPEVRVELDPVEGRLEAVRDVQRQGGLPDTWGSIDVDDMGPLAGPDQPLHIGDVGCATAEIPGAPRELGQGSGGRHG